MRVSLCRSVLLFLPAACQPPAPSVIHEPSARASAVSDVCQTGPHLSPPCSSSNCVLEAAARAPAALRRRPGGTRIDSAVRHVLNNLFDLMCASLFKITASGSSMLEEEAPTCLCVPGKSKVPFLDLDGENDCVDDSSGR